MTYFSYIDSPLGRLCAVGDGARLTGLYLPQHKGWSGAANDWRQDDRTFEAVRTQLAEYFAGQRHEFAVPLALVGTAFQQRVWRELLAIPFGETISYAELARRIGQPSACRAVGHANGCNPISILVPCHRVIGASGKLSGYAGGLSKKEWLIAWERQQCAAVA